ncbi:MAG: DUF5689 domain-containing protein [Flavobacteriaceae bacterium]
MYDFNIKIMKFYNRFTHLIIASILAVSCQQEDIFDIPYSLGAEENQMLITILSEVESGTKEMISITQLKDLSVSGEAVEITSDLVMKGYVTSSDATANFYKEIYIQDDPTSPTDGVRLLIDFSDSYNMFNIGREIYISLKGFYIGEYRTGDGVVSIGEYDAAQNRISNIREAIVKKNILRSSSISDLTPLKVKFSEISDSHIGIMVEISDVNVVSSQVGKPFVDPNDSYDTQRNLEACEGFGKTSFILETSAFANFKQNPLPAGTGTIAGIVSKTYNGDNLVLMLNSIDDVNLTGEACSLLNINDFDKVLEETFDNVVDNSNFDYAGWINYAEVGGELWTEQFYGGNGYVEFSGFRTGDDENIGWLVTPAFDLSGASSAYINFKLAQHHLDDEVNNTLEVFVSTDFDGSDVLAANWDKINVTIPGEDVSWYAFQDVGLVDVSSYSGNLYVAFKYVGSGNDTTLDGGYFVDDVLFLKQ